MHSLRSRELFCWQQRPRAETHLWSGWAWETQLGFFSSRECVADCRRTTAPMWALMLYRRAGFRPQRSINDFSHVSGATTGVIPPQQPNALKQTTITTAIPCSSHLHMKPILRVHLAFLPLCPVTLIAYKVPYAPSWPPSRSCRRPKKEQLFWDNSRLVLNYTSEKHSQDFKTPSKPPRPDKTRKNRLHSLPCCKLLEADTK